MADPIVDQSLRAEAMRSGDGSLTARTLTGAAVARHDAALHGHVAWAPVDGGLQGIPLSFKGLDGVAGLPTFAGAPRASPAAWAREDPMASRVRTRSGVITGKTPMAEIAFGGPGASRRHAAPRNPRVGVRAAAAGHRPARRARSGRGRPLASGRVCRMILPCSSRGA